MKKKTTRCKTSSAQREHVAEKFADFVLLAKELRDLGVAQFAFAGFSVRFNDAPTSATESTVQHQGVYAVPEPIPTDDDLKEQAERDLFWSVNRGA